ncbi:MAG: hypothetical protein ACXWNC_09500, partial [Anaerolineales bacterium]
WRRFAGGHPRACAARIGENQLMVHVLSRHKYKLLIISLLLAASIISVLLARARIAYSNTNDYSVLIWNLGLA